MEDCNMMLGDCIVICCCTQCLILQMIILVLFKLPCKLIRKTKGYAKKKLGRRNGKERVNEDEALELQKGSISAEIEEGSDGDNTNNSRGRFECCNCIEQAEKMLEELSGRGEFAFGSFWGRGRGRGRDSSDQTVEMPSTLISSSCLAMANELGFDATISYLEYEYDDFHLLQRHHQINEGNCNFSSSS